MRLSRCFALAGLACSWVCPVCVLVSCATPPSVTQSETPAPAAPHALHNVHRLNDRVFTGAQPEGDADLNALKSLGVKTILSVDGSAPDVAAAQRHGLRYVHVPTTYATVTDAQRLEIARAIRDLPGPIYIHCHHGKHRGPAAAAAAAIALGMMTNEEGTAFIKAAGTAPAYAGLYERVATAPRASEADLDAAPNDFPSIQRAHGTTAAMVEIDLAFDHLTQIKDAGWKTPKDNPDLVSAAEAGRLTDNFRVALGDTAFVAGQSADYANRLAEMVQHACALEEAIVRSAAPAELQAAYASVQKRCTDCHTLYRNVVRRR